MHEAAAVDAAVEPDVAHDVVVGTGVAAVAAAVEVDEDAAVAAVVCETAGTGAVFDVLAVGSGVTDAEIVVTDEVDAGVTGVV